MSCESSFVTLLRQDFKGAAVPESGSSVGEEARLRAAFIGAYECVMGEHPQYDFSAAVFYNGDAPDPARSDEQRQFEVKEEITEMERILTIQSTSGRIPFKSLEIIPVEWGGQPLDFEVLEVSETRRTVTYKYDLAAPGLRIRISGMNVGEIESVNPCVWACGFEGGVRFREAQAAFVERQEAIRIDMLNNTRGETRGLEAHLLALLGIITDQAARRSIHLECRYLHQVVDGGPEVSVPVVGPVHVAPENWKETISSLASGLDRWRRDYSTATGTFLFGIGVYSANAPTPALVLHLQNLLLPTESIAGMEN